MLKLTIDIINKQYKHYKLIQKGFQNVNTTNAISCLTKKFTNNNNNCLLYTSDAADE